MIRNRHCKPWLILLGLAAAMLAAAGVFIILLGVVFDDTSERCYATHAEAKAEESSDIPYVPKGWIPSFFPTDSRDICMWMDLDTSQVIVGYRYETAAFASADVTAIPVPPASEIPFLDEPELTHERITRAYSITSSDGLFTLVVDEQARSALLWSR